MPWAGHRLTAGSVRSGCEHTFVSDHDPNLKGNIAELKIAAAATELGIDVLRPMTEHCRYDLAFDVRNRLYRIQCKWAARRGDVVHVSIAGNYLTAQGYVRSPYTVDHVDAVAAYCGDLDRCYLLPITLVEGMNVIYLRLAATRNGQRACLNWAADYELDGAVAQLGRASRWQREGRGFESHQLHSRDISAEVVTVGAHEYRNHFGWYMERAAAGESFLITRRGTPYARLSPAQDQLDLSPAGADLVAIASAQSSRTEAG